MSSILDLINQLPIYERIACAMASTSLQGRLYDFAGVIYLLGFSIVFCGLGAICWSLSLLRNRTIRGTLLLFSSLVSVAFGATCIYMWTDLYRYSRANYAAIWGLSVTAMYTLVASTIHRCGLIIESKRSRLIASSLAHGILFAYYIAFLSVSVYDAHQQTTIPPVWTKRSLDMFLLFPIIGTVFNIVAIVDAISMRLRQISADPDFQRAGFATRTKLYLLTPNLTFSLLNIGLYMGALATTTQYQGQGFSFAVTLLAFGVIVVSEFVIDNFVTIYCFISRDSQGTAVHSHRSASHSNSHSQNNEKGTLTSKNGQATVSRNVNATASVSRSDEI